MKRMTIIAAAAAAALALTSCVAKTDANGWYENLEAAEKAAGNKKAVLFLVTSDGDPEESAAGIKAITETPDFANGVSEKFVCCRYDFSSEAMLAASYNEGATEKEQKAAEKNKAILQEKYKTATMYGVENTPVIIIVSPEGYWIHSIGLRFENDSVDGYIGEVMTYANDVDDTKAMVAATKKGSVVERVQAIDKLFETQPEASQIYMTDLVRKVQEIDRKNESGLVGKYVIALANSDAYDYVVKGDTTSAVKVLTKAAENKYLKPEEAQSLYYFAANIMAQTGSTEFDEIIGLLNKAIEVAPESEYNGEFQKIIAYIESVKAQYAPAETSAETPAAPADANAASDAASKN